MFIANFFKQALGMQNESEAKDDSPQKNRSPGRKSKSPKRAAQSTRKQRETVRSRFNDQQDNKDVKK